MFAGERFDFVLEANNNVSNYWMRLFGLADCSVRNMHQEATLRYSGAPEEEPSQNTTYMDTDRRGLVCEVSRFIVM